MKGFKGDSTDVSRVVQGMSEQEVDEAIHEARESARRMNISGDDRTQALHDLAIILSGRVWKFGGDEALDEAIDVMREVVMATPEEHPQRLERLFLLEDRIMDKYSDTKELTLINESIDLKRNIVKVAPEDEDLPGWLNYLASSLGQRYKFTGAIEDLDEAIEVARKVYELTLKGRLTENQIGWGDNLSYHLLTRYRRLGAEGDLNEAIEVTQNLLKAEFRPDSSIHSGMLESVAVLLLDRYARRKNLADLDEAVATSKEALDIRPELLSPDDGSYLNTIAMALAERYMASVSEGTANLEEAITLGWIALAKTPDSYEDNPIIFSSQANRLHLKYNVDGNVDDLDKSIELAAEAVDRCPKESPYLAGYLEMLALGYSLRYEHLEVQDDFDNALLYSSRALEHPFSITSERVQGGVIALYLCEYMKDWNKAYEVSTLITSLAPKLTPQSLGSLDKQHAVGQSVGLARVASRAAAAALNADKGPLAALTLLEQCRGLFATSLDELRTDVIDLQTKHPELAQRFIAIQNELDPQLLPTLGDAEDDSEMQSRADWRFNASKQFEALTTQIRRLPGFEDFLLAPKEDAMQDAASEGPIAVINISKHRCDALVVEKTRIRCISLPDLNMKDIEKRAA